MKYLYINTVYQPYICSGAEKNLQTLVKGTRSHGHDVFVLTTCEVRKNVKDLINVVMIF